MDLQSTDEQRLMVDTFRAFFSKVSSSDVVRAADRAGGHDGALWSAFTGLGGPLLSLPEEAGGGGGSLLDAALVGLEAGRRLAPIAYADAVVAPRTLWRASRTAVSDLPVGQEHCAWAPAWAGDVTLGRGRMSGQVRWTRSGAAASWLVVDAGPLLALVDLAGEGVVRRPLPNLGGFPMAEIRLESALPAGCWPFGAGLRDLARAESRVLVAAELVGAGRQAIDLALGHVKERRQFDRVIGSFQAIQHRLADRHTAVDAAELLVLRAASHADDEEDFRFFSAVAVVLAAEAGELAAKEALQFFGGYGFTVEYDVHLYLRYAKALAVMGRDPHLVDDALPPAARRPADSPSEGT